MRIKVIESSIAKELNLDRSISVSELAKRLNIVMPSYIAKINNRIVPDTEKIKEKDEVEFFKIISGG